MKRSFYAALLVAMFFSLTGASGCAKFHTVLGVEAGAAQCTYQMAQCAFINENPRYGVTIQVTHIFDDGAKVDEGTIQLGPKGSGYSMYEDRFPCGERYEFTVYNALGNRDGGSGVMVIPAGCPTQRDDSGRLYHYVLRTSA